MTRGLLCVLQIGALLAAALWVAQPARGRAQEAGKAEESAPAGKEKEKEESAKPAADEKAREAGKAEGEKKEKEGEKKEEAVKKEAPADPPKDAGAGLLKILKRQKKDGEAAGDGNKEKAAAEEGSGEQPASAPAAAAGKKAAAADDKAVEAGAVKDSAVEVNVEAAPKKKKKKDGDKKAEKKDGAARKKEPSEPMFRLRDGTRLAGTPDLSLLAVATAYGRLVVPVPEVIHVRFAALEDPQLAARVAENVKALGSEEFDKREEAMAALREIGTPALAALKKSLGDEDEEIKTRAEKLIGEIEETVEEEDESNALSMPLPGEEDEVRTLKFVVKGRVEEDTFQLKTRYGALKLAKKDILSIAFRDSPTARITVPVPGATFAAANKWVDTKVAFSQGERLHITASGQINLENYGQMTGPEGTTNVSGNQLQTFAAGALVGKVGDKGQPFLVGSEYDGAANASGNLFLGVSLQNGQASGQFDVEIEKEGESS
jgi:hypothetical protein